MYPSNTLILLYSSYSILKMGYLLKLLEKVLNLDDSIVKITLAQEII